MPKKLTAEFIAQKAKNSRIDTIPKIGLWNCDLDDVSIVAQMPNLEVISLSVNKIVTLEPFQGLPKLKELYLRQNLISDIREIQYLTTCPKLKVLWLSENPIAGLADYRKQIIRMLPNLTKLDDIPVSDRERQGSYSEPERNVDNYYNQNPYGYGNGRNSDNYSDQKLREIKRVNTRMEENPYNNNYYQRRDLYSARQRNRNSDDYGNIDYELQRKQQMQMRQQQQQMKYNNYYKVKENPHQNNYYGNEKVTNRSENVMRCMMMLLNELNPNELEYIVSEIDKKISKY